MAVYTPQSLGIQAPTNGFQTGGWYSGRQFWNGTLSDPGTIHPESNQQGAGQAVSADVIAQTNPANVGYVNQQRAQQNLPAVPATAAAAPQTTVTQAASTALPTSGGGSGPSMPTVPGAPAPFDLNAVTNAAYNTPELQAAQKAISDRQAALATAQAGINDNPFYSESTRVGKSQQLTSEANADIQVQQNNLATLQADAARKVNAATGQYNINQQAYQQTLSNFNTLLQAGGLTNASPQDLASMSVQTGIPVSELQSIQTKQKNDSVKTALVTGDNGTISVIDTSTGRVISQTNPGVGTTTKTTTASTKAQTSQDKSSVISDIYNTFRRISGPQGFVSREDWAKMKQAALNSGLLTPAEFNSNFASFTNPEGAKTGYIYQ